MRNSLRLLVILLGLLSLVEITPQTKVTANEVGEFSCGLAPIKKGDLWGFMDVNGNIVIDVKYGYYFVQTPAFSEGLVPLHNSENDKWGYLDTTGKVAIPFKYGYGGVFSDGIAFVYDASNTGAGKTEYCFIDKSGKIVIPSTFINRTDTEHQLFKFNRFPAWDNKSSSYGYIDGTGKMVTPTGFYEPRPFSEGLAAVQQDYKWGFIDTTGKVVIPFQFSMEPGPFINGRSRVQGTNFKFGFIDTKGNVVVEPKYQELYPFTDEITCGSFVNEKFMTEYEMLDRDGKVVKKWTRPKNVTDYALISGFVDGLALARKDFKIGYVDKTGKVIVDYQFQVAKPFKNGRAYAELYDKKTNKKTTGFIDKKGKFVIITEMPQF